MRLKIFGLDDDIYFDDITDSVLVIEDSKMFGEITFKLNSIINGTNKSNEIVILDDSGKLINKNCILLTDLLNVEVNSKKIITTLYRSILLYMNLQEDNKIEYLKALNIINTIIDDELDNFNLEFSYNEELGIEAYLKAINLQINQENLDSPYEVLANYFELLSELNLNQVILLVNTISFFSDAEFNEILKMKKYKHLNVLFIENMYNKNVSILQYVIDQDYCQFTIK